MYQQGCTSTHLGSQMKLQLFCILFSVYNFEIMGVMIREVTNERHGSSSIFLTNIISRLGSVES